MPVCSGRDLDRLAYVGHCIQADHHTLHCVARGWHAVVSVGAEFWMHLPVRFGHSSRLPPRSPSWDGDSAHGAWRLLLPQVTASVLCHGEMEFGKRFRAALLLQPHVYNALPRQV
jgi:hypothetical protein